MTVKTVRNGIPMVALAAVFLGLPGCTPGDQPELGHVTGTVTLNGLPLSGVEVVFYPDSGRPARGRTDFEGKYDLRYIRDAMGAKVGHNRVEIAPSEEGGDLEEEEAAATAGEETGDAQDAKKGKPVVPARYNTKSELEADVEPGENTFDFELKS